MKYQRGKPFSCKIGKSKPPTPFDYLVPTAADCQRYLNFIGTENESAFEREYVARRTARAKYEKDIIHNKRQSGRPRREPDTVLQDDSKDTVEAVSSPIPTVERKRRSKVH